MFKEDAASAGQAAVEEVDDHDDEEDEDQPLEEPAAETLAQPSADRHGDGDGKQGEQAFPGGGPGKHAGDRQGYQLQRAQPQEQKRDSEDVGLARETEGIHE